MSACTTLSVDNPDLQGSSTNSPAFIYPSESLYYALTHVFLPIELPDHNDYSLEKDLPLVHAVCAAAHAYSAQVNKTSGPQWLRITRMLDRLQVSLQSENLDHDYVISELRGMKTGDILTFFIRRQNAAIILTKHNDHTLFEPFEVSPREDAVEGTPGSLVCSYPWLAVEVPDQVFDDRDFQIQIANFLSLPGTAYSGLSPPPTGHPQYITSLLSGILRCIGRTVDVPSITKRIRDDVRRPQDDFAAEGKGVWRRSSLWLLIRVAVQLSIDRCILGRVSYKGFVLFFICTFARDAKDKNLSTDLLHLMSSKILRRLSKLGSTIPHWLSEMALEICAHLWEILNTRWMQLQSVQSRPSPFQNPSQDELERDTRLSLLDSREYICNALANRHPEPLRAPFQPNNRRRGTIDDFLSSDGVKFFEDAYKADPDATLYDIEKLVERDIDEWFARVTKVDEACVQLEILMDRYLEKCKNRDRNPEDSSIALLTALELFVVLDKLAVKENPILVDYSPEIPTALLETLLLRKAASFHRLSRAYQYLSMRHSQSRPGWSVLSDEFTEDSFPVRYYDQSLHLQRLKARIDEGGGVSQSRLPAFPLHTKVVIFELQCPASVRIWRSAGPRILHYFYNPSLKHALPNVEMREHNLLARAPALQPYFVHHGRVPLTVQIHFACFDPEGWKFRNNPALHYAIQHPFEGGFSALGEYEACYTPEDRFSVWRRKDRDMSLQLTHKLGYELANHGVCSSCKDLAKYVDHTTHTSNEILAAQVDCPADLSVEEFITFAQLRSGGSLQWVNVLRGLRSRTLNLRRHHVHYLLSHAIFQVGPLDLNTGTWIWHQELEDSSFCSALLDELDSLFVDVGAGSIDGMMMSTISLLLTRVLVSSPSEAISERVVALLRSVRKKTFSWVQELSYNLAKAPTSTERNNLLLDMTTTCRSTFDVNPSTLSKLFHSAEDVDAALSCNFLLRALRPDLVQDNYSRLLLGRDRRLSFALENILRDEILADVSNYGVDLAVRKVFVYHKPSAHRWKRTRYPNARWLTCKTKATEDRPLQTVFFDLLDGTLRVDGRPLGGLPRAIRDDRQCQNIFRDQGFFVIPSNLPGMDFTTLAVISKYKVHFSLRGDSLVVRAQCNQSNDILELIPARILKEDLPPALIRGHVHWLNLSAKAIEIRPSEQLWEQSSENWRIDCRSGQYRMYKGRETLVDIESSTWETVSERFECLNNINPIVPESQTKNLLITVSPTDTLESVPMLRLSVALPRYGLSFFVNSKAELESRDFKNMVYDEDKCIGTLFGLEDFLVLRQKKHLSNVPIPRRVLIPKDKFMKHADYQVWVNNEYYPYDAPDEPLYHSYHVDTELGCLVGNGNWTSTRHLARLHAMTSCHRPDPLTDKTGAQAALHLFQSAGCQSIMKRNTSGTINHWDWKTPYPQIQAANDVTEYRKYWYSSDHEAVSVTNKRAMRRAAYLFPLNATGTAPEDWEDMDYLTLDSDLELEGIAFTAVSAIRRWSINGLTMDTISDWAAMWSGDGMRASADPTPYLPDDGPEECSTNLKFVQTLHNALEMTEGTRQRFSCYSFFPQWRIAAFLSMLVTLATSSGSQRFGDAPTHADCKISDGYRPMEEEVWLHFCKACLKPENYVHPLIKRYVVDAFVKDLLKGWPSYSLASILRSLPSETWDVASLTTSLQQLFSSCYRNFQLKEHLIHALAEPGPFTLPHPSLSPRRAFNESVPWKLTLDHLLSNRPPPELVSSRSNLLHDSRKAPSDDTSVLNHLFSSISIDKSNSPLQREYITLLQKSAQCVRAEYSTIRTLPEDNRIDTLEKYYAHCRVCYLDALGMLKKSLAPTTDPHQQALSQFGQWPPITADVILRCLASTSRISLPPQWKRCLVSFALLLLNLQRARRLLRFALDGLEEEFSKELENEGCDGWDPEEYPDWLLIQIQGNFLIRRVQAEIAMELMAPQSGENAVMQANMGEGKSSVIIPIAAAVLANGKQLVRVIVPKALTVQMFEILVSRLGGLANRPIYYLPFSRSTESTSGEFGPQTDVKFDIRDVQRITHNCLAKRGILLVQPEHVASLKLMSVEEQIRKGKLATAEVVPYRKLIYKHIMTALSLKLPEDSIVGKMFRWLSRPPNRLNNQDVTQASSHDDQSGNANDTPDGASKWLNLHKWIHSHARDILDESDEILHARFQLIYTIGLRQHTDGYPTRWTTTQEVLRLVKKHAYSLSLYAPDFIEHECGPPGSFPYIHILRPSEVGQRLTSLIVEDVMTGQLPNFKFQCAPSGLQDAIRSFLSDEDVLQVPDTAKRVEEYANMCSQQVWNGLLHLRGLLTSNVLLFSLAERRWRVDYGLVSPSRNTGRKAHAMLAVPYRAKDVPAPNTQFGHPDIAIILTCLSYYYGGLEENQLRASFEILLDEDDPSIEFALWTKEYDSRSFPESLRTLSEINLKSSEQWDKVIFPLFTRNQAAIDFYLSRVVFPQTMKEYPWKLCVSSWDLAEKREQLITGFSGTNDDRWLLPMSITQRDLDHQQGTNARGLTCLLQPENSSYEVTHESGERWITVRFLQMVVAQQPEIRVLLDVGAQILDSSNREVAKAWLEISRDAAGAIHFNENDELIVLMRNGITVPLLSSSLSQQLDRCVVYLDHAHTRGTDIKLPIGSRAAVTLGPKVTKDRLVQGCMRMRKLGHGHSVMFFAPPEVDRSIRAVAAKKDSKNQVTTVDILSWAINETWIDIQQRAPYWAQQGMNHKARQDAWIGFASDKLTREKLADAWLQPDLKSLATLYAPSEAKNSLCSLSQLDPEIRQRCKNLGVLSLPNAQMAEEQEREVNREREREREVELPPKAEPAKHYLHPDIVEFVNTGKLPLLVASSAFHPVFTSLEKSSAATREANVWSPFILATADFCNTIKPESTQGTIDQYLRPVQWILTRKRGRDPLLVLLSPFEVDRLMTDIRASEYVHLHQYVPRTSQRMKPSDDLRLYSIPPLPSDWTPPWALIDQLNVFAGQLYLRDYNSYLRLCRFLGVPTKETSDDTAVQWNLFNVPGGVEENEIRFSGSPLPSVMALLSIRSRGRPFTRTHMGQILQGNTLTPRDFVGPRTGVSPETTIRDGQTSHDVTSGTMSPPPADMECDAPDGPELLRPFKRRLDVAEVSDEIPELPKKCPRVD